MQGHTTTTTTRPPTRAASHRPRTALRARGRQGGFFYTDAIAGMAILVVLAVTMAVALGRHRRGTAALADKRGATWAAEHALAALQAGGEATAASPATGVQVEPLAGGEAPAGQAWVRVRVEHNGKSASLVGLVPQRAVPPAGQGPGAAGTRPSASAPASLPAHAAASAAARAAEGGGP